MAAFLAKRVRKKAKDHCDGLAKKKKEEKKGKARSKNDEERKKQVLLEQSKTKTEEYGAPALPELPDIDALNSMYKEQPPKEDMMIQTWEVHQNHRFHH